MLNVLFFALQHGYSMFQLQMSMGQTRKNFFMEQCVVLGGLLLIEQLMIYGMYHFEIWKIQAFYAAHEVSHITEVIQILFRPTSVLLITLLGLSTSLLLIALALRFGAKANLVMVGVYMIFMLSLRKMDAVSSYFEQHSLSTSLIFLLFLAVVLCAAVFLALAWQLMKRLQVN